MTPPRSTQAPESTLGTLSVREVCEFDLLRNAKVLAGSAGLNRRVQRLNVMSVPDIARWTKPQELLLATGFPLPDTSDGIISLLCDLDDRGVAAFAIKLGDYRDPLDASALQKADELGLPIIALPEDVAFNDILSEVLAALTNRQAAALSRAQNVHQALLRISLSGGGLSDIVRELSSVLGGIGVVCVNTAGEALAQHLSDPQRDRLRQAGLLDEAHSYTRLSTLASDPGPPQTGVFAAQVSAGELHHGYLLAVSADGSLEQEVRMMVEQAAIVAALNVSRDLAVSSVARRFEASAIHGLLAGSENEIQEVAARSSSFEWDLNRPLTVLAACREITAIQTEDVMKREHDLRAWTSAVRTVDRHAAAGVLGRNLVAICGAEGRPEELAARISENLKGATRSRFLIGISSVVSELRSLPRGYHDAQMALEFTRQAAGSVSVRSYDSLGLFRLFNAVTDRGELRAFVDETLGPVLALSEGDRDEMLSTLDVLLKTRMNVAESSRILRYHYNTLRYRVRKLEQLLGAFTDDYELELRITVALQIMHMWRIST